MLLADVCGGGSLFGEIAGSLRELMIRNVNSIQQTRLVRTMGHRLEGSSQHGGYASALVTTYFAPTRSFSLCNVGHPPPLLFRARSDEWSVLKQVPESMPSPDAPLGVIAPEEYQQLTTTLASGDLVLSYSNVFTECIGGNGRMLGVEGFLGLVRQLDAGRPSGFAANLVSKIVQHQADNLADVDATLLVCCATETPVAWWDNLLAPFRLLRRAVDKTKIQ